MALDYGVCKDTYIHNWNIDFNSVTQLGFYAETIMFNLLCIPFDHKFITINIQLHASSTLQRVPCVWRLVIQPATVKCVELPSEYLGKWVGRGGLRSLQFIIIVLTHARVWSGAVISRVKLVAHAWMCCAREALFIILYSWFDTTDIPEAQMPNISISCKMGECTQYIKICKNTEWCILNVYNDNGILKRVKIFNWLPQPPYKIGWIGRTC